MSSGLVDWSSSYLTTSQHSWIDEKDTDSFASYSIDFPASAFSSSTASTTSSTTNNRNGHLSYAEKARKAKRDEQKKYRRMENERNAARNREKKAKRQAEIDAREAIRKEKREAKELRRQLWQRKEERKRQQIEAEKLRIQLEKEKEKEERRKAQEERIAAGKKPIIPVAPRKLFIGLKWADLDDIADAKQKEATTRRRISELREICQLYGKVQKCRVLLPKKCMFVLFEDARARTRILKSLEHHERRKELSERPEFGAVQPNQYYVRKPKSIKGVASWGSTSASQAKQEPQQQSETANTYIQKWDDNDQDWEDKTNNQQW